MYQGSIVGSHPVPEAQHSALQLQQGSQADSLQKGHQVLVFDFHPTREGQHSILQLQQRSQANIF
jgi:hypothetical protein